MLTDFIKSARLQSVIETETLSVAVYLVPVQFKLSATEEETHNAMLLEFKSFYHSSIGATDIFDCLAQISNLMTASEVVYQGVITVSDLRSWNTIIIHDYLIRCSGNRWIAVRDNVYRGTCICVKLSSATVQDPRPRLFEQFMIH